MKIKIVTVLLLSAASLVTGCSASHDDQATRDKRAKLHYQIGVDAISKNQLPKAFDELMLAEKLSPDMPVVLDALGYAWRLRGEHKKSEAYYKKALRYGGGSMSHTNYGSLLIEMGRYDEARVNLLKALEDPRYQGQFIASILLGDAYVGLGKYDKAIDAYRQAGQMNPNQSLTKIKEAKAFLALGRPSFAEAIYETLLRNEPTSRPALEGLLEVLAKANDRKKASLYLENFISNPSVSKNDRAWATDELVKLR